MGLPVHMLARDVGCGALGLPHAADLPHDEAREAEAPRIDAAERDRRFAEMAERNARLMFRVAHGLLRSVQDAEDAVQEALLKLYRGDGWLHMEDERAFLARTVWRAGLDIAVRRPKRTEPLENDAGREFAAGGGTAEQSLVEHGERAALRRMIDALPEELRHPLLLSAIEEMTSRQVAIALGIPEGTVRTRVMRARIELKRRFEAMRISNLRRNGDGR